MVVGRCNIDRRGVLDRCAAGRWALRLTGGTDGTGGGADGRAARPRSVRTGQHVFQSSQHLAQSGKLGRVCRPGWRPRGTGAAATGQQRPAGVECGIDGHACAHAPRTDPVPLHPSHMVVCRMRSGFPVRSTSTARTLRSSQGCASPPGALCTTHTVQRGTLPYYFILFSPHPDRPGLCPVPPHHRTAADRPH